jgi:hypothetical protein
LDRNGSFRITTDVAPIGRHAYLSCMVFLQMLLNIFRLRRDMNRGNGELIAYQPPIIDRRGQTIYDWEHYLAVVQRKPDALRSGAPFAELPDAFRTSQQQLLKKPGGNHGMVDVAPKSGFPTKTHLLNLLHRVRWRSSKDQPGIFRVNLRRRDIALISTLRDRSIENACFAALRFGPASTAPELDHPVDPWLDPPLRLLALDPLQKQLVVISHVVAQERLHGDADGHSKFAPFPSLGHDFSGEEVDSKLGTPRMPAYDMRSNSVDRKFRHRFDNFGAIASGSCGPSARCSAGNCCFRVT